MDNEDPSFFQSYSEYEYVSRKRRNRGKQRKSQVPLVIHNHDEESNPEPIANLSESENEEIDSTDDAHPRISVDSLVSVMPDPNKYEDVLETAKTPENEIDKLELIDDEFEHQVSEEKEFKINHRALPKHASTYELEKFDKKALVIFNQVTFEDKIKPRLGTEKDVESLTRTFESFGFEVVEHTDLTKDEIFKELKEFSERDFTDYGCVAIAVLTHGSNNGLLRAKDHQYSEIEIINHFKVQDKPTLVTKPKILVIQACRGTKIVQGALVFRSGKIRKDYDEDLEPYILPVESDMLILHSSYVGSPSHRDELTGSWFIQSLCNKINQLASTYDLESIMTEVKREVAIDRDHEEYNRRTFEMDINKQMPVMTSTLIRKLYLRKCEEVTEKRHTESDKLYLNTSRSSKNEVLDAASAPNTPLLVQFGPCSCFLNHFTYMRQCLSYYSAENPADVTALNYLEIANTFEDDVKFNNAKESMTKLICQHLNTNGRSKPYFRYIYFYKH